MKIACYGFIDKESGSATSANFLLLKELLERGHKIDLYAIENFVCPKELFVYENLKYFPCRIDFLNNLYKRIPQCLPVVQIYSMISTSLYYRAFKRNIINNHKKIKYDLLLFLGVFAPFRIKGLISISWPQSAPQIEWESIRKLRGKILNLCGRKEYYLIKAFYIFDIFWKRRQLKNADFIICGSQLTAEKWVEFGAEKKYIQALPYAMDLSLFKPQGEKHVKSKKNLLWLGRITPRKRLDLLLDSFILLMEEKRDVYLKIIGHFPYAKRYKKLIENLPFPDHIEYKESISHSEVPSIMQDIDILIQPSENEDFASSPAEALCCGVPVIVGPLNGTKDYINPQSIIFEDYTAEALKKAIVLLLNNLESNSEQISIEARKTAEFHFNVRHIADEIEKIFLRVLRQ